MLDSFIFYFLMFYYYFLDFSFPTWYVLWVGGVSVTYMTSLISIQNFEFVGFSINLEQ